MAIIRSWQRSSDMNSLLLMQSYAYSLLPTTFDQSAMAFHRLKFLTSGFKASHFLIHALRSILSTMSSWNALSSRHLKMNGPISLAKELTSPMLTSSFLKSPLGITSGSLAISKMPILFISFLFLSSIPFLPIRRAFLGIPSSSIPALPSISCSLPLID